MATHVIHRGRALPIGADALVIGRDPAAAQELRLPEGIAGLSRRHCTLRRERGRSVLIDHSSHGSYLDGVRVRGRAFLSAGSVLRLGTPGVELHLVALADAATES
jgi:pSer/pThr/pTyr-binding forkhead associated (FHA) protein